MIVLLINRRMPKCNTVLQTEKDLFQSEIRPNSPENCHFLTVFYMNLSKEIFLESLWDINMGMAQIVLNFGRKTVKVDCNFSDLNLVDILAILKKVLTSVIVTITVLNKFGHVWLWHNTQLHWLKSDLYD